MRTTAVILAMVGISALACGTSRPKPQQQVKQVDPYCPTYEKWQKADKKDFEDQTVELVEELCAYTIKNHYSCVPKVQQYCNLGQLWAKAANAYKPIDGNVTDMMDHQTSFALQVANQLHNQWRVHITKEGPTSSGFDAIFSAEAKGAFAEQTKRIDAKIKAIPDGKYKDALIAQYNIMQSAVAMANSLGGYSFQTYGQAIQKKSEEYKAGQNKIKFMTPPATPEATK